MKYWVELVDGPLKGDWLNIDPNDEKERYPNDIIEVLRENMRHWYYINLEARSPGIYSGHWYSSGETKK